MATSNKASMGQRFVTALIALFCALVVVALLGSAALVTWYGIALGVVALCGAYVFGHIAVRGRLPGNFRAGGNAFVGSRQNVGVNGAYRSTPVWQRVVCGALAVGGGVAIVASLVTSHGSGSHQSVASLALALGGFYLFGYIALRGHLPNQHLGGGNAAINHQSRRNGG